ncbi:MAG: succinylglutamate desuccinylase/aspartoacylase family protein [Proteobacteria bacterium]|nr:succinylglutamate desuccinylase/aspartoacylase family protein [Pseudomonadota bacterium]MBU1640378.1 succinylglutamate desuccinylase/aspartoacylase family protein [Pseudomonadota bacterium]
MTLPVHVVHGKKDGPVLFISAAIHGDEINGVEIVRRLLKLKLLKELKGTLIAIPIVNVFGFINQSRYLPDRRDLNRSFPGSYTGSLASHLARLFMDEIVAKCTHGIDLHSGSSHRTNLPQIRATLDNPEVERLAIAFGAPVIVNARLRDSSLREAVIDRGIPMLLFEGGESLRFNEHPINIGLKGIVSVMRNLGMLPKKPRKKAPQPVIVKATHWVRANKSGIIHSAVPLGSLVKKNQVMACIIDPIGDNEEKLLAPFEGIIIGSLKLPLVHKGDAIFHLASAESRQDLEEISDMVLAETLVNGK